MKHQISACVLTLALVWALYGRKRLRFMRQVSPRFRGSGITGYTEEFTSYKAGVGGGGFDPDEASYMRR